MLTDVFRMVLSRQYLMPQIFIVALTIVAFLMDHAILVLAVLEMASMRFMYACRIAVARFHKELPRVKDVPLVLLKKVSPNTSSVFRAIASGALGRIRFS